MLADRDREDNKSPHPQPQEENSLSLRQSSLLNRLKITLSNHLSIRSQAQIPLNKVESVYEDSKQIIIQRNRYQIYIRDASSHTLYTLIGCQGELDTYSDFLISKTNCIIINLTRTEWSNFRDFKSLSIQSHLLAALVLSFSSMKTVKNLTIIYGGVNTFLGNTPQTNKITSHMDRNSCINHYLSGLALLYSLSDEIYKIFSASNFNIVLMDPIPCTFYTSKATYRDVLPQIVKNLCRDEIRAAEILLGPHISQTSICSIFPIVDLIENELLSTANKVLSTPNSVQKAQNEIKHISFSIDISHPHKKIIGLNSNFGKSVISSILSTAKNPAPFTLKNLYDSYIISERIKLQKNCLPVFFFAQEWYKNEQAKFRERCLEIETGHRPVNNPPDFVFQPDLVLPDNIGDLPLVPDHVDPSRVTSSPLVPARHPPRYDSSPRFQPRAGPRPAYGPAPLAPIAFVLPPLPLQPPPPPPLPQQQFREPRPQNHHLSWYKNT